MTRDAQLVHHLLTTLNEYLPGPQTTRTNPLNHRQHTGEAPTTTTTCTTCQGHGKRGKTTCTPCNGTGTITVDAYTNQPVNTPTQHVSRIHYVNCDSCAGHGAHGNGRRCWHCDGTGQRRSSEHIELVLQQSNITAGTTPPAWMSERKAAHYRSGSYQHVEDALNALEHTHPTIHRTLLHHLVYHEPRTPNPTTQQLISQGCEHIANHIPKPIRVPAWARRPAANGKGRWANQTAQTQRNNHIHQLRSQGHTLTQIAHHTGLTRQRISQILRDAA